jgi:(p)ppGpp synthase/HD superfamily hydrolase
MKNLDRKAFLLAVRAHQHQKYGDDPYIVHLFDVVNVLHRFQHTSEMVLAAAWLHDVIEDTPLNYHDVKNATNEAVADIVLRLTDEIGKNRKERKAKTMPKLRGELAAQTVKLADWIANVEEAVLSDNPKSYRLVQMYKKDYPDLKAFFDGEEHFAEELYPMWYHLSRLLDFEA